MKRSDIKWLYHRTPHKNVASIMKRGLIPEYNFVCLSEGKDGWYNDYALLAIDIYAFMDHFPDVAVTTWQPDLDEICVWGIIPAKYITKVEVNK